VGSVFRVWAWIVWVAIIVQIGFAGYGAFFVASEVEDSTIDEDKFMDGFGIHSGFGYLVVLFGLILLLLAFAARIGKQRLLPVAGLFGLLIVQVLLAWFGFEVPAIGFFHPINAVVLAGISYWIASTNWKGETRLEQAAGGV
jgi:hypothetical protein